MRALSPSYMRYIITHSRREGTFALKGMPFLLLRMICHAIACMYLHTLTCMHCLQAEQLLRISLQTACKSFALFTSSTCLTCHTVPARTSSASNDSTQLSAWHAISRCKQAANALKLFKVCRLCTCHMFAESLLWSVPS